ncbi:hypothetical protein VHEMI10731 [[Torrubiella] hemipterigena]|uniref:JmjC domain-containing protein n=1 Tax=[Torrubiella] hemipterigena TaxID=1531966 RepID=A0A0A1TSE4_9HYPO|nr:hypothetical protein VHEMI10731 [[Torrubiella] hemipterigena]
MIDLPHEDILSTLKKLQETIQNLPNLPTDLRTYIQHTVHHASKTIKEKIQSYTNNTATSLKLWAAVTRPRSNRAPTLLYSRHDFHKLPEILSQAMEKNAKTTGIFKVRITDASHTWKPPDNLASVKCSMQTAKRRENGTFLISAKDARADFSDMTTESGEVSKEEIIVDFHAFLAQDTTPSVPYRVDVLVEDEPARTDAGFCEKSMLADLDDDVLSVQEHNGLKMPDGIVSCFMYQSPACKDKYAVFPLHTDDHRFLAIQQLHKGRKIWIAINPKGNAKLEGKIRALKDMPVQECSQFVRHTASFIPLPLLETWGIDYEVIDQKEGEIVIVLGGVYHQGFTVGASVGEARNYADKSWSAKGYRQCNRRKCGKIAICAADLHLTQDGDDFTWEQYTQGATGVSEGNSLAEPQSKSQLEARAESRTRRRPFAEFVSQAHNRAKPQSKPQSTSQTEADVCDRAQEQAVTETVPRARSKTKLQSKVQINPITPQARKEIKRKADTKIGGQVKKPRQVTRASLLRGPLTSLQYNNGSEHEAFFFLAAVLKDDNFASSVNKYVTELANPAGIQLVEREMAIECMGKDAAEVINDLKAYTVLKLNVDYGLRANELAFARILAESNKGFERTNSEKKKLLLAKMNWDESSYERTLTSGKKFARLCGDKNGYLAIAICLYEVPTADKALQQLQKLGQLYFEKLRDEMQRMTVFEKSSEMEKIYSRRPKERLQEIMTTFIKS